jgi:hypothetical protein
MKVVIKKLSSTIYEILEGSELIENEVWGDSVKVGDHGPTRYFHYTWLNDVIDKCKKLGYKLEYQGVTNEN